MEDAILFANGETLTGDNVLMWKNMQRLAENNHPERQRELHVRIQKLEREVEQYKAVARALLNAGRVTLDDLGIDTSVYEDLG